MESDTFTKKYNFRLPDRTIKQLDKMIDQGVARNRTEALIYATDDYGKSSSKLDKLERDLEWMKEINTRMDGRIERLIQEGVEYRKMIEVLIKRGLHDQKSESCEINEDTH